MTNKPPRKKIDRNPVVMLIAVLIWIGGACIVTVTALNYSALGAVAALLLIGGGLSSMSLATMTIVTGKPEWILLDLLLPA